ncbi:MAG: preprotein translocase subunit SecE [Fidelibacterota bacterium]|nr:MAG: preprotein translocase subunit SecE [Candidatus Neomarinimicrobiota bacterium]
MIRRIQRFLKGVEYEMRQVSWPTLGELRGSTAVVLVLSILLVIFLFVVDFSLARVVSFIL